jgi:hypothetical protein
MLTAAVSGSFHRHMDAISGAVKELMALSVRVLSPADPTVVAAQGEFLFVASDRVRSVRLVQDRHLESIRAASFLWLVCPDGYVGQSASMEIGFAAGASVPIFATHQPSDLTLREYVIVVPSIAEAVARAAGTVQARPEGGILIDPGASIEKVQQTLEQIKGALTQSSGIIDPAINVHLGIENIRAKLRLPTYLQ